MFPVTKIQRFCTKDGPGIRTTVFLKGCPLRCLWCHNPETQSLSAQFFYCDNLCIHCGMCAKICPAGVHQITDVAHLLNRAACTQCMKCTQVCPTGALEKCFRWLSAEEIFHQVIKDKAFYGAIGGVTFSGGEPTVHAKEMIPLLNFFHRNTIHTAIETCGYFDKELLPKLIGATDLFLWDIKDTDDNRHLINTGVSNNRIISNLKLADTLGAKTVLRCILLKSVNLNTEHLQRIARIYSTLKHSEGVELIPYHTYGTSKNIQLGQKDTARQDWIPSTEDIVKAETFLAQYVPIIRN